MRTLQPPTSRLPPIQNIASHSPEDLLESLLYLRTLYTPEVRGSRRRKINVGETPKSALETNFDNIRSDAFERSYAIRWLTACISQIDCAESDSDSIPLTPRTFQEGEALLKEAASLLAVCAGTSAAGTFTRLFIFESVHTQGTLLSVHLTDVPLDNHDFGSVGAQTWGGACVLAETMVERPGDFGLTQRGVDGKLVTHNQEFRVLELGAGTGLVSLTLGKLLGVLPGWATTQATILATDFHPSVLANLQANVASNFLLANSSVSLATCFLNWSELSAAEASEPPFDQPFDLVLGADIVYEAQHAVWIKQCLTKLLRRPQAFNGIELPPQGRLFHLIIPLRPTHAIESNTIEEVFPIAGNRSQQQQLELAIVSKEVFVCDTRDRSVDEVRYAYYKIGWC